MIVRTFDPATGFIRVTVSGMISVIDARDHYARLRRMIADVRKMAVPIRILVDIRGADRQSAETEAVLSAEKENTYWPGDRVAVLARDVDSKNHVRALLNGGEIWCWQSELAAEQWLMLDGHHIQANAG